MTERLIRSLKEIIEVERQTQTAKNWKPVTEKATQIYNNRVHSRIKQTPNYAWEHPESVEEINKKNSSEKRKAPKSNLKVDDYVLTVYEKTRFQKGYHQRWNNEPEQVVDVIQSSPKMYLLSDGHKYYIQELQHITKDDYESLTKNS